MTQTKAATISSISVVRLFGRYSYHLPARQDSNLLILYGDNGSGKTTILRLIFHVMSPARHRGHRTWIGGVPFERFRVDLSDGTAISVARTRPTAGSYTYEIYKGSECINSTPVVFDEDNRIANQEATGLALDDLLPLINGAVKSNIYHIRDDRIVESDQLRNRRSEGNPGIRSWHSSRDPFFGEEASGDRLIDQRAEDLSFALSRATRWARDQAHGATTTGTATASSIYVDVIKRIVETPTTSLTPRPEVSQLLEKIAELEQLEEDFGAYGLAAGFVGDQLRHHLKEADEDAQPVIAEILQPYLGSLEARFQALESLKTRMEVFVEWIDSLLKDKWIYFNIQDGIRLSTYDHEPLSPAMLSSGERHLLLLLASTLYAQQSPSIFLIDEPELSLNIKWQRQFLEVLTECTQDSSTQFVMATHSFEILSGHDEFVVHLEHPSPE